MTATAFARPTCATCGVPGRGDCHPSPMRICYAHAWYGRPMKKQAVNVTLAPDLIEEAKALKLNLSALLEEKLREERARRWKEENAQAFAEYNADVEKHGVWSDGRRSW